MTRWKLLVESRVASLVFSLNKSTSRTSRRRPLCLQVATLILAGFVLVGLFGALPDSYGRQIDSLVEAADSACTAAFSEAGPGFWDDRGGVESSFGRPARRAELHIPGLLGSEAGIFQFRFGTLGWPDTISLDGADPNRTMLSIDGMPFNDLITGRPRYDLLPYTLIDHIRVSRSSGGVLGRIRAVTQRYENPQPHTDLRYRSSSDGLTYIDAVHTQNRRFRLMGKNYRVQLLGGYSGSSHTGEYRGSRLRLSRRLNVRIRVDRPAWNLELFELFNRHRIGAHSGVVPIAGQPYESIFQRIGATVGDPDAKRRTVRNDLQLRYRRAFFEEPLTLTGFWSTQRQTFENPVDSLEVRIDRLGLSALQDITRGTHHFRISTSAWVDNYNDGSTETRPEDRTRTYAEMLTSDSMNFPGGNIFVQAGAHSDDGTIFPSARVELHYGVGNLSISYTGIRSSWMDTRGFGSYASALEDSPRMRKTRASAGAKGEIGEFSLSVSVFAVSIQNMVVWTLDETSRDARASILSDNLVRVGSYLDLAFRSPSTQGLYGLIRPAFVRGSSSGGSEAVRAEINALPEFWVYARFGIQKLLFEDDLNLDVSIRTIWSASMNGRRLDTRTGLLMLPGDFDRSIGNAGRVDLMAEAEVKTATIFLSLENIFHGKNGQDGILLTPDYPLPARRFRFGIFWPIEN